MKTLGIKPALPVAVVTAVITYLLTQSVLELPPGVVLACQALVIALGVAVAGPGNVVADADDLGADPAFGDERGQYDPVYLLVVLVIVILVVWLVLHLVA